MLEKFSSKKKFSKLLSMTSHWAWVPYSIHDIFISANKYLMKPHCINAKIHFEILSQSTWSYSDFKPVMNKQK